MIVIDIAILVGVLLVLSFALAPSTRSGTVNPIVAAAGVAAIIAAAPVLFALTGVLRMDWPWLLAFALALFVAAFLGGRAMAGPILARGHSATAQ